MCVCFFYVEIQLFKFQNYTLPTHLLDLSKQLTDFSFDHNYTVVVTQLSVLNIIS